MKRIVPFVLFALSVVAPLSAQSLMRKAFSKVENALSIPIVELPSPDEIRWYPLVMEGSRPKVTSNEYCIMLHSPDAIQTKVCGSDGVFYIDGKPKSREACRTLDWKVFRKYTHVSSNSFKDGKYTCYYLLEQEVDNEGDIVKREVHVIKY